jgi:hypothetical protein
MLHPLLESPPPFSTLMLGKRPARTGFVVSEQLFLFGQEPGLADLLDAPQVLEDRPVVLGAWLECELDQPAAREIIAVGTRFYASLDRTLGYVAMLIVPLPCTLAAGAPTAVADLVDHTIQAHAAIQATRGDKLS